MESIRCDETPVTQVSSLPFMKVVKFRQAAAEIERITKDLNVDTGPMSGQNSKPGRNKISGLIFSTQNLHDQNNLGERCPALPRNKTSQ